MIRFKETFIRHSSDVIQWFEGTGQEDHEEPVRAHLLVALDDNATVKGLSLMHKSGHSINWRTQQDETESLNRLIETGRATEEERERPVETNYQIKGTIRDPKGNFNPRFFQKTCGNNSYPKILLYRSPGATLLSQQKVLEGLLKFQKAAGETSAKPASWALVRLTVDIGVTDDHFVFNAQADRDGYFRIPLTRLSISMLASGLTAVFTVKADKTQSGEEIPDPDLMNDVLIAEPGTTNFVAAINAVAVQKERRLKFGFIADDERVTTLELKHP